MDNTDRLRKIKELLDEIRAYEQNKRKLIESLKLIRKNYQAGQYGYFRYQELMNDLLEGRSKKEWIRYYNSYIYSLLKQIDLLNSRVFYEVYNDKTTLKVDVPPKKAKKELVLPEPVFQPNIDHIRREHPNIAPLMVKTSVAKVDSRPVSEPEVVEPVETKPTVEEVKESKEEGISFLDAEVVDEKPTLSDDIVPKGGATDLQADYIDFQKRISEAGTKKKISITKDKKEEVLPWLTHDQGVKKAGLFEKIRAMFTKKKTFMDQYKEMQDDGVEFRESLLSMRFLKDLISRKRPQTFVSKKTELSPSILALKRYKENLDDESKEKLDTSVLLKEANRMKNLIKQRRRFTVYEHSALGSLANVTVRKFSLALIDAFPDFFRSLYDALRLADMRVLSNTYVNLGVLISMMSSVFFFSFFFTVFLFRPLPIIMILIRSLVLGLLFGGVSFMIFYLYPFMKIKKRRRNINTNLPFAINHMSAVSSSGVPPDAMFRLIAQSEEYREISIELGKIAEYIDVFGYDLLTAVKSVATITPSPALKEFFDGFISTVETGGDLKHFLEQKAEEAMLSYKLERQKYTESISTYSDIYTGLLIAAPLFFVVALSLVSLLGGKIASFDVNTVIALGTYMIIPLLNCAFIVFLELTQPEV